MAFQEAKESMGVCVRWTENPKNTDDKSIYLGTVISGYYVNLKTDVGRNESNLYEIKLKTGELVGIWGSGLLDGKFKEIPMGSEVRITYLGVCQPKTPKGRAYQNFKVEFDPTSKAPMQTAGLAAAPAKSEAPVAEDTAAADSIDGF